MSKEDKSENVLDAENWKLEASAVAQDIKLHVKEVFISKNIPSSNSHIYFNLTTLENASFCIELSAQGFRIAGTKWDDKDNVSQEYFETPYSLLNKISVGFTNSFSNLLSSRLQSLKQ